MFPLRSMVHCSPLKLCSYMVASEELCLMTSILSMVPLGEPVSCHLAPFH